MTSGLLLWVSCVAIPDPYHPISRAEVIEVVNPAPYYHFGSFLLSPNFA